MAKLLGAGSIHMAEQQPQNLELVIDHREEAELEAGEVYSEKLEEAINQNIGFLERLNEIKTTDVGTEQVENNLNDTKDKVIHPYLNHKTSFYKYEGKKVMLEVSEDKLQDVEFDTNSLLKL